MRVVRTAFLLLAVCAAAAGAQSADTSYTKSSSGLRQFDIGAIKARVLLDSAALRGGELEMVELTFPAGSAGAAHRHGRLEIIYVLEGAMDHVVNGTTHRLVPGSVGIVRTGDSVIHRATSSTAVRALVIWAPGGELPRLERR